MSGRQLPGNSGASLKSPAARILDERWWHSVISTYVSVLLVIVTVASIWSSYTGVPLSARLSFWVDDGWCDIPKEGFAGHCFGDFGVKFQEVSAGSHYATGSISPANTPVTILVFKILAWLDYNNALAVWQSIIFGAGVVLGLIVARKATSNVLRLNFVIIFGVANLGAISSFDRGNPITLIALLLVGGVWLFEARKPIPAILLISFAATLKFWGPLFFLYPLFRGRWRLAVGGLIVSVFAQLGGLMIAPVGLRAAAITHWGWLTNREYGAAQVPWSHSLYGLVSRFSFLQEDPTESAYLDAGLLPVWLGAIALSGCVWSAIRLRRVPYLPVIPLLLAPVIALPEAMAYNTILLTSAIGVIFIAWFTPASSKILQENPLGWKILVVSLLFASAPLPLDAFLGAQLFSANSVPLALIFGLLGLFGTGALGRYTLRTNKPRVPLDY